MTVDSDAADISLGWGARPSTLNLIAYAASVAPQATAFEGKAGPVPFAALNATVSMTAGVLAAQGIDTEAAVGAAVTGQLPIAGMAPDEIAAATREAIDHVREVVCDLAGTRDWGSLAGLFRSAVHRFAGRTALTDLEGASLTYAELEARSDELAHALRAAGAGPETLVGVALPRNAHLIVTLLGVIKTGAAYLPLDRSHPVDRLNAIVDDAHPLVVLTDPETLTEWDDLNAPLSTVADLIDRAADEPAAGPATLPEVIDPRHPAYVMYTSGSTGKPKGVVVTHSSVVTLLSTMGREYGFSENDVWTMFQSYAFDVSVGEIWAALSFGGRLVVLDYLTTRSPADFVDVLEQERVTVVNQTPSAFYQLASAVRPPANGVLSQSLRVMMFAGETLDYEQVRRWQNDRRNLDGNNGPQMNNMYGPTETTVYMTRRILTPEFVETSTANDIGGPFENSRTYVLDSRLRRVPDGVPGDLYIAGDQLARGYAGRFALNATRFVADPFGPAGSRMYQTGDVVAARNGSLEFVGRSDSQVKLRGFRIELGEVEAALLAYPGVHAAAASIYEREGYTAQLVGYVVGVDADGNAFDPLAVKAAVAAKVPDYMVPDVIMVLDRLPLNVNGKLDRKALPKPVIEAHVEYEPPADETERVLVDIFTSVLGLDDISVTESVFDVGGNSLVAAQIVGRACEVLNVDLNMRDLFEAPTVRGLAARARDAAPGLTPISRPDSRPDLVPLSFAQQRMWFINQMEPDLPTYNIPALFALSGEIDVDVLRVSVADVVARHEILRTTFPDVDGTPFQLIGSPAEVVDRLDWRVVASVDELAADMRRGFDVADEWPLRARVLPTGPGEATLALVAHHIAFDGQSFGPLAADLLTAYDARSRGAAPDFVPLDIQFADYALWQRDVLGAPEDSSSVLGRQLAYWRERLAGLPDVLELPADRPRPLVASHRGDLFTFDIPAEVGRRVDEVATRHGATRFMVLHAAFAVLLARLTGIRDIAVGTPIGGRGQRELDAMVGMFVNTLVLRTHVDSGMGFDAVLGRVRADDLDAFAHADVPFESVVDSVNPVRSAAFSPLVQVILSVDPLGAEITEAATVNGLTVAPVEVTEAPAQVDLNLTISTGAGDEDWSGILTYATDLFDVGTVEEFSRWFVRLLDGLLTSEGVPVGDIELFGAERVAALTAGTAGPADFAADETIADLVAARVADSADAVALVAGGRAMAYGEFGLRVAGVARALIAAGVGPDTAVGVVMRRSAGTVIAVHAIMAAGGQYVPIDPDTPADRARYMVETAGIGPVLVEKGRRPVDVLDVLDGRSTIIEIDADAPLPADAAPLAASERLAPLRLDDAAYTLFTSGSTGRPKGVTISHRAVANFVAWFDSLIPAGPQRLLFKTPHTFDASVLELFWPLTAGQTMVVADAEGHRDPEYLADVMAETGVTIVQFVPSLLSVFLDVVDRPDLLTGLQVLFSGGEALPPAVLRRFGERVPNIPVVNLFGPTEAAVYTMSAALDGPVDVVPIGRPMPNTSAYVLDDRLHPVPDGVAGELYLGGVQSARGYAARPDLTAERFVADPFGSPGARLYRTGDLVRRRRSGELDYLGRTDFQVKLRGQRLELGEVESAIADAPGVVHAAARVVAGPGGDQLVGYVAPATVDVDAVRESLAASLSEYMRPTAWVLLDEMPLNSAGKVDRRSLPAPELAAADYVAPETDAEERVAAVFATLLDAERVSVTESFFDLGGNSLSAMRLVARVSDTLGVQVSVRDIFDAPTVRELAKTVAGRSPALPPITAVQARPERVPLSFAQQRMWFINKLDPSSGMYNIPMVLRVTGDLDVAALRAAVVDVVARHEILRTTFPDVDGTPFQLVHGSSEIVDRLDWRLVGAVSEVEAAVASGFVLEREWPVRVRVWEAAPGEHVVAVVMHHIASDGGSFAPLVSDLVIAYLARSGGESPVFAPLPVSYADFALWQREVLGSPEDSSSVVGRQLAYWTEQLAGLPDVLELPTDRPRPQAASGRGVRSGFEFPPVVTERVRRIADANGVTPFMVLHAALAVTLSRLSGTDDIAVGTPVTGRGQQVLEPLVGMFVNTLVLRTEVGAGRSFTELLDHVHAVDVDAFAHADVPFEAVVDAVDPVRSEAFAPLAQVMLVATPTDADASRAVRLGDLEFAPVVAEEPPAQRDLTVNVEIGGDGAWAGSVIAAADLFDVDTARRLADQFVRVVAELSADPSMAVGDVDMLSVGERDALAQLPVPVTQTVNSGRTLVELFAGSVAAHRDMVAVSASVRSLSYAELDARSDAVAAGLIARGVSAGDLVGVATERSVDLMSAILGVLKAGAGYLPLDLGNPVERLSFIVADAEVSVVIGDESSAGHGLWGHLPGSAAVVDVDVLAAEPVSDGWAPVRVPADARAYVIYTSGSTGRPKGVEITHRDVVTLMDTAATDFEFSSSDVWTMFHSYAFDFSVWEMWGPLLTGARLLIVDLESARDPRAFLDVLAAERVTVLSQTPSAFYQLIDARRDSNHELALRYVVFGGEALSFDQVRRWFDENPSDSAQLVNMYGITETTVHVSYRPLDRAQVAQADASFIGRPLASLGIHILDERLHPVPEGVPGEMYVTGGQLAAGYLKRPGLSATRFVADPFAADGSRMYRTGDRARRIGSDIEYLGRGDAQVQLRGFRIEFGEIEAALLASSPIASAAAARVLTDPVRGDQLVGYLVVGAGQDVDAAAVRAAMAEHVPGYMVPDVVVGVERLPLNHNGKLDRKALPAPEFAATEYVAPESAAEEAVAAVFAELLGVDRVGVTESFFDLGGNSLSAARLAARASAALGVEVSVRDVFDSSSVRDLVAATADAAPALPPVVRVQPRPDRVPLSFAQQRMWFINQLEGALPTYNIPALLRISGPLDLDALHAALCDVIERHEVLRTAFPNADGEPFQLIHGREDIAERFDWAVVSSRSEVVDALSTGFAVERDWPIRVRVFPSGADEHVLAIVMHHIASDGESLRPFVNDLVVAYVARAGGAAPAFAEPDVQYADYAIWQHEVLGSPEDESSVVGGQVAYWGRQLAGLPDVLELPADRQRPRIASGRGGRREFVVPAPVAERVRQVADERGVTPFMVVHAALAVLLSRLSGSDDVAIATPVAGRGQPQLDPLVGMFVNTLVLRSQVGSGDSFEDLLARIRVTDIDAFANADVPFEAVVDAVKPVRSEAFSPLAQVMLTFDSTSPADYEDVTGGGLAIAPIVPDETAAQRDLTVSVSSTESGDWSGSMIYAADLFDAETVDGFASRLVTVLDTLTAAPAAAIGDGTLLSAGEADSIRAMESGPSTTDGSALAGRSSVADAVSRAVAANADAPALIHGDRAVSFGEFGARVAVLARELISAGVGPNVAVAVVIPRSVEMMIAIHAVVAAGGQYVPVDPDAPADRVAYMLRVSGAGVALVHAAAPVPSALAGVDGLSVRGVDASGPFDADVAPVSEVDRRAPLGADDALYTLFTSGSTGRPKGVTVSHRSVLNRLAWMDAWYPISGSDRLLQKTPVTFDVSVWELFWPLMVGVPLVIAEPGRHGDPEYLREVIADNGVSVVHFVPSMLSAFTDVLGDRLGELTSLRHVFASGEALAPSVADAVLSRLPGVGLHNLYGPTEAAVDVTAYSVRAGDPVVPIGSPVPNTVTRVLDSRLTRVPIGAPGELYLGGVQVARGYAARPDLTAERFVADPFGGPGARLYRTGDLVRWNASGELEYLGRTDFQVKLRGQRLELGEVEAAVSAAPGVVHSAAVVAESAGGQQLVAYVAPADVDMDAVRDSVAAVLPAYMCPSVWVPLDAMPLTVSGKVDRKALPAPVFEVAEYVAPASDEEERVAAVFASLLDAERVSVAESFFDLGGNSLSAMRLVARVSDALGVQVGIRDVFDTPSVRELVAAVAGRGAALPPVIRVDPRPEALPLSRAQRRMWFLNQFDTTSGAYNIPAALTLSGSVDDTLLFDSVCDVIERHEVLRTVYPSVGAAPVQEVLPAAAAREMFDWAEADSVDSLVRSTTEGFDVSSELPIRGRFHRNESGLHIAITTHHIAMDGQSIPVLARDLLAAYASRAEGSSSGLPVLDVQYADYAVWQQTVLGDAGDETSVLGGQLAYWRRALAGLPEVTDLPMDRRRPAVLSTAGATVTIEFDDALADGIDAVARDHTMTAFMVTEAAFAATVARLASTTDVVIGTPVAGRNDAALEDLIGMFVNTLLLRTHVEPGHRIEDLLDGVRTGVLDAFAHDQVQFDDLIEALAPERSSSYQPLAQIAFTYTEALDGDAAGLASAGIEAAPVDPGVVDAKFDLTVAVRARSDKAPMAAEFIYATDLFDASTVERFADVYRRVLQAVIDDRSIAVGDIDIVGAAAPSAPAPTRSRGEMVGRGGEVESGTLIDVLAQRDLDPDHPALIFDGTEIDYDEFETRTNAIARALLARGVSAEDVVAVGMERSIGSVLATWGVIKSGAAYVPVDPAYPADRIAYMLGDSGAALGITDAGTRARLGESACEWIDLADLEAEAESGDDITDAERNGSVRLSNLAYLIYTSGSTGRPKAVGVSHTGIVDFVNSLAKITTGTPEDEPDTRILHVASPSFDASMFEMAWAIPAGHTLVIAPHTDFAGDALAEVLDRDEVTDMIITPSVLATVDPERAQYVRNLATGGEACPPELVERWSERGRRIFNCYGPTEATVWATRSRLTAGKPVTIGKPVDGFTVRVLDGRLHEVPQGVVGELYLSTAGLARGYLGRPGQTATSFVADPFGGPGARMYATGDLVRVAKGGNLEFAGRADHQVKINGQRVELGEIEAVLDAQPGVAQSVVVGVESTRGGRKHTEVVAYLVAKPGATIDSAAVLDEAALHLAAHMVPSQAIAIDEIPLTPAGKLDRTALPEPHAPEPAEYVAPANPAEENLARIVGGLLGDERVSVTESFFALGGDSIMSIQLSSAAKAAGIHLSPREIFELKTIRAMAAAAAASGGPVELIEELPGGGAGDMPLPPVASWMIEHSEQPEDFADFSQPLVFGFPRSASAADLHTVVEAVAAAHPMLTAVLTGGGDEWTLTAGAGTVPAVREIDATGPMAEALLDAHRELLNALDPASGSLFGTAVVTGDGWRRLVIAIHHLGVDAVSWPILVEDLVTAWAQQTSGRPIELRPEGTSARRIAHLLADQVEVRAGEVDYWLEQLPVRPTSFGDTADGSLRRWRDDDSFTYVVSDVAGPILTAVPQAFGSSVDDVLLGALARAIRSWQRDHGIDDDGPVTVHGEGHGRSESIAGDEGAIDLSRTVGWFTSITPLAVDPSTDVIHAIKSAKDARVARPAGGVGFGILRYNSDGELARRPLPTILYNFFGGGTAPAGEPEPDVFLPAADGPHLPATVSGAMRSPSVFGINIGTAGRDEKRLEATITYATDVLDEAAASEIVTRWHDELRAVVDLVGSGARVGLSRTDVPGVQLTQDDLDRLAEQYPGADVWPMTPLQQGLFFQADLAGTDGDDAGLDVYITQTALSLRGDVDTERLRTALGELVARHRVLRSGFVRVPSGAPVTVVPPQVEVPWSVVDMRSEDPGTYRDRVEAVLAAERAEPFDMARPPLIRTVLIEHADGTEVVITNHHLLIDGWSSPLVLADLLTLYATGETFTRPGIAGSDFADHARAVATADREAGLAAWREVLAPVTEPTLVAPGHEPSADAPPRDLEFTIDVEVTERLEALARDNSTTMATVVQFAWAVFLSRLTGVRTVSFGETVSGRSADIDGMESMIGMFINTIPAIVDVAPDSTVLEVLTAMQDDKVKVLDHQQLGLPMLIAQTGLPGMFDTLTVYESFPVNVDSVAGIDASAAGGLQLVGAQTTDATHYPLNLSASRRGAELTLKLKYLPSAFTPEQVDVFAEVLTELFGAITRDPHTTCDRLPLLSAEHGAALTPVSGGPASAPVPLHELFADAARRAPDTVAVIDGTGTRMTYRELDESSNRLARWLIGCGVGPDRVVVLAMGRSARMLTAIWAVAKTGGAYVPVDPEYPSDRVSAMIEDSSAMLGLAVAESGNLPSEVLDWVRLDDAQITTEVDAQSADALTDADRLGQVAAENLAYVIFTSGSTGRPKGVAVTHSGLANLAHQESLWLNAGESAPVVLGFASPSFDASFFEYLLATETAGTIVYRPSEVVGGPELEAFITEHGVTHIVLTPPVLSTVDPSKVPSLQVATSAGEAVPQSVVDRWGATVRFHNLYGPTEATVWVSSSPEITPGDPVRIGGPIGGTELMVLDTRLRPVPVGMPGELYIAGPALARGYLDRFDLTAERFTANPYGEPGQRMYRSGDVVRWLSDGAGGLTLDYLGRTDDQVKLRGLRIELGEIEAVLFEHPAVESAVVIGVGGSVATALAAYVVPSDGTVDVSELKSFAGRRLPSHMVPSSFTVIEELPLTPAGKLDKRALPEPTLQAGEYVEPTPGVERTVADVVAAVLGIDAGLVSATSSFFELGGDSLSAARLGARLSDQLGVAVSVRDVFEAGSVRALAGAVGGFETAVLPPVTAVTPRPDRIPLSFAQQRIWFINQLEPEAPTYNISVGVLLAGLLDVSALEAAVGDVVARHEVLRTTFPDVDGEPFQLVHAADSPAAEPDWAVVSGEADLVTAAGSGFDVAAAPPFRVRLLKVADDEHILLAVLHHLVGDGESMQPLIGDIVSAYLARAAGGAPQFAPLDVQFADYALWQRSALGSPDDPTSVVGQQLDYWARQLAGAPDVLELPADRPRPTVASHRGAMETVPLPAEVSARVDELARERGVTPFMVVHAALAVLLSRLSATEDIAVATPIAGRGQQALEPLVGMFVNTLVLRTPVAPRGRFADLLDEVRSVDLEAFAHADVPFESIVERVQPVRSQAFAPLAQVMVTVVDQTAADSGDGDAAAGELSITPVESPVVPAQYDLTLTVGTNRSGDGEVRLIYATDLFDARSVRRLAERFVGVLDHLSSRPDALVADAPLMTDAEHDEVLGWSRGASDGPAAATLIEFATGSVR